MFIFIDFLIQLKKCFSALSVRPFFYGGIVNSDKRINLCEGADGKPMIYTMTVPAGNDNITFKYDFKDHLDGAAKNATVALDYNFGTPCWFFLEFSKSHASWRVERQDVHYDLIIRNQTLNHFPAIEFCHFSLETSNATNGAIYNLTIEITNVTMKNNNAVCNSFLSFDSAITLVSLSSGGEVMDENEENKDDESDDKDDEADWTLVMVILCSALGILIGSAVLAVVLVRFYSRRNPFIRVSTTHRNL